MSEQITFLRAPEVERRTGRRRSSRYRGMQAGLFPKPIKISERNVAWREDVIDEFNRLIASGASEKEIAAFCKSSEQPPRRIRLKP